MPLKIKVRENGPIAVDVTTGDFILVDHNDVLIPIPQLKPGKTAVTLCRCGHSSNMQFCDSTHRKIDFKAHHRAPPEQTSQGDAK